MKKKLLVRRAAAALSCLVAAAVIHGADASPSAKPEAATMPTESVTVEKITLGFTGPAKIAAGCENNFTIKIMNGADEAVAWYSSANELKGFTVAAKRNGEEVPMTLYGHDCMDAKHDVTRSPDKIRLEKGQELTVSLNLTRYLDLSRSGDYEIQASWYGETEKGKQGRTLKTPALKVRVDAKN